MMVQKNQFIPGVLSRQKKRRNEKKEKENPAEDKKDKE